MKTLIDVQNTYKQYLDQIMNGIVQAENIFIGIERQSGKPSEQYINFYIDNVKSSSYAKVKDDKNNDGEIVATNVINNYNFDIVTNIIVKNSPLHMQHGIRIMTGFYSSYAYTETAKIIGINYKEYELNDISTLETGRNKIIARLILSCYAEITEQFQPSTIAEVGGNIQAIYSNNEESIINQNYEVKYK